MSKRKINGKIVALIAAVLLVVISLFKIPNYVNHNNLAKLGYSEEAIKAINDKGLRKTILSNNYYSDLLAEEITKDTFNIKYLQLYLNRASLTADDITLYERIQQLKGYSDEEMDKLFIALDHISLQPLIIFDKLTVTVELDEISRYIKDCQDHPTNTASSFKLKYDYLKPYEDVITVENPEAKDVFISTKRSLGTYAPANLETVSRMNAVEGVQLEKTCKEKFDELCTAVRQAGLRGIYAYQGYYSYESQENAYAQNPDAIRPGHNERQTGLLVRVVSSENENAKEFTNTEAYKWLKDHAHEYGFIFRYPQGKEIFTGFSDQYQTSLRYVGVELATKIHSTGLSYDEYYWYFLA